MEENYLKAIFKIFECRNKVASINVIVKEMSMSVVLVIDMVKCFFDKDFIYYECYKGVILINKG